MLKIKVEIHESQTPFDILMRKYKIDFSGEVLLWGHIKEKNKLQAVKLLKDLTGLGLKEAKDEIDKLYI